MDRLSPGVPEGHARPGARFQAGSKNRRKVAQRALNPPLQPALRTDFSHLLFFFLHDFS